MDEPLHLVRTTDGGSTWRHDRGCFGCGGGALMLGDDEAEEYATVSEQWLRAELGSAPF